MNKKLNYYICFIFLNPWCCIRGLFFGCRLQVCINRSSKRIEYRIKQKNGKVTVLSMNKEYIEVDVSLNIMKNQVFRASMLDSSIRKRNNDE